MLLHERFARVAVIFLFLNGFVEWTLLDFNSRVGCADRHDDTKQDNDH